MSNLADDVLVLLEQAGVPSDRNDEIVKLIEEWENMRETGNGLLVDWTPQDHKDAHDEHMWEMETGR